MVKELRILFYFKVVGSFNILIRANHITHKRSHISLVKPSVKLRCKKLIVKLYSILIKGIFISLIVNLPRVK